MQNTTISDLNSGGAGGGRRPRTTSANRFNSGGGAHNAWSNVAKGHAITSQSQPQTLNKNAWGVHTSGALDSPVSIKRGHKRGAVINKWNDGQQDSGLADDQESKIDISKAYQACLNKYNLVSTSSSDHNQPPLGSSCDIVGSNCGIYVTEVHSTNQFLGIENNKELKISFQSLKKLLEQSAEGNIDTPTRKIQHQANKTGTVLNSFVCVNDASEGLSRGFVVSITNQICDVYLIDWGYINEYHLGDVWTLSAPAIGFCRPLARLFEIAGAPTDLPFPEGLTLPALFHVKVMAHNPKNVATVVKVKYRGRDLIDYYYEPGLIKQSEEQSSGTQKTPRGTDQWAPKSTLPSPTVGTPNTVQGVAGGAVGVVVMTPAVAAGASPGGQNLAGGGGDESSSATNSVVEEWLMNTADEQFSHFDEGPPSPTDDEDLANLMEQFELGDSVSAVHPNTSPPHPQQGLLNQTATHHVAPHQYPAAHPNFNSTPQNNFSNSNNYYQNTNQYGRNNHQNRGAPDQQQYFDGGSPRDFPKNITSISSKLNIKAGSNVKILISYVVLPTFFNFIPINQTTNKFREQLKVLLNSCFTSQSRRNIDIESSSGQPVSRPGQYFVSKIRGDLRRVTVKLGHACLEKNKFVKIQDVDFGGELIARIDEVFQIPEESVEALKNVPVLRCNGSMNGLHPNSTTRRWSPEQCQSFRQLTEHNILDATVARVTLSPQMSVPYYNFDLYFSSGNQLSIADIMRAFEYAS